MGSVWNMAILNLLGGGTLNISNGGAVHVAWYTNVNSGGVVNFGPGGGALSTQSISIDSAEWSISAAARSIFRGL